MQSTRTEDISETTNTIDTCNNKDIPDATTAEAAGYDLYSAATLTLTPHTTTKVPTDLGILPPMGTYCQMLSWSGKVTHHGIQTTMLYYGFIL
jgi:dUTPase